MGWGLVSDWRCVGYSGSPHLLPLQVSPTYLCSWYVSEMLHSLEYGQSIVIPISNQIKRKEQNQTDLRLCWLVGWMEQKERKPKGYKFKCRCGSRRPYGRRMMCFRCYEKFLRVSDCLADWIDLSISQLTCFI